MEMKMVKKLWFNFCIPKNKKKRI